MLCAASTVLADLAAIAAATASSAAQEQNVINPKSIFQRSEKGRAAILRNERGLTQAEREVLVLVDGVANLTSMQANAASLERLQFERALQTLIDANMVVEVLLAPANALPDHIAPDVAMRFVDQDTPDPVAGTSADRVHGVDAAQAVAHGGGSTPALSVAKEASTCRLFNNSVRGTPTDRRVATHRHPAPLSGGSNASPPKADSGVE
jgi:hypothetical protein